MELDKEVWNKSPGTRKGNSSELGKKARKSSKNFCKTVQYK